MVGSRDSHSQCSHWLWQFVPHGRASGFFNCPRSGSVSRNTPIPCFGGIQDATLAHKRGSLETLGFKWHSLDTFCCYWQKVTRRRQQKREGSWTAESCLHKYSPPLRSQCSHRLWRSLKERCKHTFALVALQVAKHPVQKNSSFGGQNTPYYNAMYTENPVPQLRFALYKLPNPVILWYI